MNNHISSKPSFWKWNEWTEFWPHAKESYTKNKDKFQVEQCSPLFQKEWKQIKKILNVMLDNQEDFQEKKKNCISISKLREFSTLVDKWATSKDIEDYLTYPPTMRGFNHIIEREAQKDNIGGGNQTFFIILALTRPEHVAFSLESLNKNNLLSNEDLKILQSQRIWNNYKKNKEKYNTSTTVDTNNNNNNNNNNLDNPTNKNSGKNTQVKNGVKNKNKYSSQQSKQKTTYYKQGSSNKNNVKIKTKEEFRLSEKHYDKGKQFSSWLEKIKTDAHKNQSPLSIQKQSLNEFLKNDAICEKGMGEEKLNYWFEDVAFPAMCTMNIDDLKYMYDIWPDHFRMTWNYPVNTMNNSLLWYAIGTLENEERQFITQKVLPDFIHTDEWNNEEKYRMLETILNKKSTQIDWLFKERLQLWLNFGGELNDEISLERSDKLNETSSAFVPYQRTTPYDLIKNKHNEKWDKITQILLDEKEQNQYQKEFISSKKPTF